MDSPAEVEEEAAAVNGGDFPLIALKIRCYTGTHSGLKLKGGYACHDAA